MRVYSIWMRWAVLLLGLAGLAGCACSMRSPQPGCPVVRQASMDGVYLSYVDTQANADKGAPLVLIPGWACDTSFWNAQIEPLSAYRRVLVLDMPGHGKSDTTNQPYTQQYFARAVLTVMDKAGVDKAVLVGHSMGGSIARMAAILAPERIAGVVLADAALFELPQDPAARKTMVQGWEAYYQMLATQDDEQVMQMFLASLHGPETPEWVKAQVQEKMISTDRSVRLSAFRGLIDPAVWEPRPVQAPTLCFAMVAPDLPQDYNQQITRMFPNNEYHLWEGPGHFFMMEPGRAEQFNKAVLEFVQRKGL